MIMNQDDCESLSDGSLDAEDRQRLSYISSQEDLDDGQENDVDASKGVPSPSILITFQNTASYYTSYLGGRRCSVDVIDNVKRPTASPQPIVVMNDLPTPNSTPVIVAMSPKGTVNSKRSRFKKMGSVSSMSSQFSVQSATPPKTLFKSIEQDRSHTPNRQNPFRRENSEYLNKNINDCLFNANSNSNSIMLDTPPFSSVTSTPSPYYKPQQNNSLHSMNGIIPSQSQPVGPLGPPGPPGPPPIPGPNILNFPSSRRGSLSSNILDLPRKQVSRNGSICQSVASSTTSVKQASQSPSPSFKQNQQRRASDYPFLNYNSITSENAPSRAPSIWNVNSLTRSKSVCQPPRSSNSMPSMDSNQFLNAQFNDSRDIPSANSSSYVIGTQSNEQHPLVFIQKSSEERDDPVTPKPWETLNDTRAKRVSAINKSVYVAEMWPSLVCLLTAILVTLVIYVIITHYYPFSGQNEIDENIFPEQPPYMNHGTPKGHYPYPHYPYPPVPYPHYPHPQALPPNTST